MRGIECGLRRRCAEVGYQWGGRASRGPISVFDGVGDRGLGGGAFPGGFSSWPGMGSLGGERSLS